MTPDPQAGGEGRPRGVPEITLRGRCVRESAPLACRWGRFPVGWTVGPRRGGGEDTIRRQKRLLGELRWPDRIVTHPWRGVPLMVMDSGVAVAAYVAGRRT